jgi:hypothetical protein
MKITTRELNALVAACANVTTAITAFTALDDPERDPGPVEASPELEDLQTAMADLQTAMPSTGANSAAGSGAAGAVVAGNSDFRAKVEAGYDEE